MRFIAGTTPSSALSRRTGWLVALFLLGGCPNPKAKFDDFVKRAESLDLWMPEVDLATPSMIYDVSGEFLLSISTTISPDTPLQLIAKTKLTDNGDGTATLDINFTPLTVPPERKVTGTPFDKKGIKVAANGQFEADLGLQMVPGNANPISGSDITATLKLIGSIKSPDRFCGDVEGMVMMPIMLDLKGSTWSAIRVTPGAMGNALPAAELKCPAGGMADAGVGDMSMGMGDDAAVPDMSMGATD